MTTVGLSTRLLGMCGWGWGGGVFSGGDFCNANELTTIFQLGLDSGYSSTKITPEAHFYEYKTGLYARHPRVFLCEMVI